MLFNPWPYILSKLRKENSLSQENAAERADVSIATWYRWESGRTYPGATTLQSLAQGVNLDVEELGLIYAEALVDHYQDLARDGGARFRQAEEPAAVEDLDPRPRPGSGVAPAPSRIRALASRASSLWGDLGKRLGRSGDHRSESETDPRRKIRRPDRRDH